MRKMKKLVAFLLTMIMVMGMTVSAFAEETPVYLTIKSETGHTYKLYQMLTGDVSGLEDGSGTLANVVKGDNLSGTVAEFDAAISKYKTVDGEKVKDGYLSGTELAAAASALIADVETENSEYAKLTGTGSDVKQEVDPGYYVIMDIYTESNQTCTAFMVAVVGDTTVEPKTSTPPFDKNITDTDANKALETTGTSKKTDTAAIGDKINYQIDSAVPVTEGYKYYYYVVNDTMSEGLTFNNDLVITIGNKTLVKDVPANAETGAAAEQKDYALTVTENEDGTTSFELVVHNMKQYTAGAAITITYSATVNKDAEIGLEPNTNTAKLTYSNNPSDTFDKEKNPDDKPHSDKGDKTGTTPDKITKTYVTELTLQKTDETGAFVDALKGATFKLSGDGLNDVVVTTETVFEKVTEGGEYYLLKDGTYTKDAPITEGDTKNVDSYAETAANYVTKTVVSCTNAESGADANITAVVDANGQIKFTGLNAGSYKLEETNVPTGYNKAADIKFTISSNLPENVTSSTDEGLQITWSSNNTKIEESLDDENKPLGVFETTIENKKGNLLPSTGGIGTTLFYVFGAILVVFAGVLLIAKKRMAVR